MTTDIRGVSTRSFFSRSTQSLGALRSEADRLQTQISTGQRLIRSSDDPVPCPRWASSLPCWA